MRMRKKRNLAPRMEACAAVLIENPRVLRGHWRDKLPGARELRLEIGCGKGRFTIESAKQEPDVLFIALEKVPDAMIMAMEYALREGVKNVFFIDADAAVLPELFSPGEADRIYLNFPDPWPRSKTARLRLTFRTFLESYKTVLRDGGELWFKTDNLPLFNFSLEEFTHCGLELKNVVNDLHKNGPVGVMTDYETRFYQLGTPINRCECVVHKEKRGRSIERIQMLTPLVELDGDEMTRILWRKIKDELILPYVDLKSEYFDLSLSRRDETGDQITLDAAEAIKKYGVGVKCATITPNTRRVEEYHLHKMWKSPNVTIRSALDGTVFRAPIQVDGISPVVRNWTAPITIARHAYADFYTAAERSVESGGRAELTVIAPDGTETKQPLYDFECGGIVSGQYNKDSSIASFARSCFQFALDSQQDLWFSAKDTVSKIYDGRFRDIFAAIYEKEYRTRFEEAGLTYFYTLIDDAVARVVRSSGGFIWALKNYDGDVMSNMVSAAFGSLAMVTSVLVSPDGKYEFEAVHGTVSRHYYRYLKGEKPSTNPVATIFAWAGALKKRGELDGIDALCDFAEKLKHVCLETIEDGIMTKDLAVLWEKGEPRTVDTDEFLTAVRVRLDKQPVGHITCIHSRG